MAIPASETTKVDRESPSRSNTVQHIAGDDTTPRAPELMPIQRKRTDQSFPRSGAEFLPQSSTLPFAQRLLKQHLDGTHVRLHDDPSAHRMASQLRAEAFTVGHDVFFAAGKLDLSTPQGVGLLTHELTHVRQQEDGRASPGRHSTSQRASLETEALTNERASLTALYQAARQAQDGSQSRVRSSAHASPPSIVLRDEDAHLDGIPELTHVRPLLAQRMSMNQDAVLPAAAEDTLMAAASPTDASGPITPEQAMPGADVSRIADEVYSIIERRLRSEKERRGYF